ncbi:MAG: diaminopimelate epimerase [Actinobacteria bacterium]|nr:diaminopimelate epimerase [Actinomycetota bacterium]
MEFAKWEGLGNDYLIIDEADLPCPLTAHSINLLCDRHRGIGSDGILLLCAVTGAVPGAVARMRIFNPDGSEPEMCGNGVRQFARYLQGRGLVAGSEFTVETLAGPIRPSLLADGRVRVDMGEARFGGEAIDHTLLDLPEGAEVVSIPFVFRGDALEVAADITFVDVGNPHCVIPVANPDTVALEVVGPLIERHPLFPRRVNVEFISVLPDGAVRMRVWERGVGETQACGTGATAVGVAAVRLGMAADPVVVRLNGGDLEIVVAGDGHVIMTGPATEVFTGVVADELKGRLGWL